MDFISTLPKHAVILISWPLAGASTFEMHQPTISNPELACAYGMIKGINAIMSSMPEKFKGLSITCGCENGYFIVAVVPQPSISLINRAMLFAVKALNPTKFQKFYNELIHIPDDSKPSAAALNEEFKQACAAVIKSMKSAKIVVLAEEKFKDKIKQTAFVLPEAPTFDKKQLPTRVKNSQPQRQTYDEIKCKTVFAALKMFIVYSRNRMSATVKDGKIVQVLSKGKISDPMIKKIDNTANIKQIAQLLAARNCFVDASAIKKEFS